ncbi:MAG: nicotinate (nicotinamide) nucleotide adenylyltransferase [Deltaproteobacteria bacterium]|nr:MAG: nicotinate (nicotinamide) nucleotide adenylyltransferase [Deltaproteobacteria bacterium]
MPSLGILGGSFNPPHLGHLRMALEVREQLRLTRIELVPAAIPPHKHGHNLLPFDLRCRLLRQAVCDQTGILVNDLESQRNKPSYTYDTLREYRKRYPQTRLFFIMGSQDLIHFASWHRVDALPHLAHLVIVHRGEEDRTRADRYIMSIWPECRITSSGWRLVSGARDIFFLEMHRLDISSSLIREKWQQGKSIRYLVPASVERYLEEHRSEVAKIWGREGYGVSTV